MWKYSLILVVTALPLAQAQAQSQYGWLKPAPNPFANGYDSSRFKVEQLKTVGPAFSISGGKEVSVDSSNNQLTPQAFLKITYLSDTTYVGTVYMFPSLTGSLNYFDRPLVMADGFDPGDLRHAKDLYFNSDFSRMFNASIANSPRGLGYDMYFIDLQQGAGNLFINAGIYLKFVEWLQNQTTAGIVASGPSMGGVLARLALLYSMSGNNVSGIDLAKQVIGLITLDSPHQGASIGKSLQLFLSEYSSYGWRMFDQVRTSWDQLDSVAARQLLYSHVYYLTGYSCDFDGGNCAYYVWPTRFILDGDYRAVFGPNGYLKTHGDYKPLVPKVSVACSNFYLPHSGDSAFNRNAHQQVAFVPTLGYKFYAGGPKGDTELHEFAPGASGDWYWDNSLKNGATTFTSQLIGNEHYKGTFVPIYSALDLSSTLDVYNPQTAQLTNQQLLEFSAFDKVLKLDNRLNGYWPNQTESERDALRYQHIVFDEQVVSKLAEALAFLDNPSFNVKPARWLPAVLHYQAN
jgi:hypothetical protein